MTTESPSALLAIPGESPDRSPSSSSIVYTPPSDSSPIDSENPPKRRPSPLSLSARVREPILPVSGDIRFTGSRAASSFATDRKANQDDSSDDEDDEAEKMVERPPMHRSTGGRSETPLLKDERGRQSSETPLESARPTFVARRSTFRSRSPDYNARSATKKKYIYAAFFLGVSLVSFVVQTETATMVSQKLGWEKPYCMLYMTHGSWVILWPISLLILRIQKRKMPWKTFWRRHKQILRTTAQMVRTQDLHLMAKGAHDSPVPYMLRTTATVTTALTIAGGSWYVAVNMTTASDLTAIYNCSAFFAYAFSIPLLGDKIRFDKVFSVAVAIAGVLTVAYGDKAKDGYVGSGPDGGIGGGDQAQNRTLGNIIIGIGSVLYGLYEVMYKKMACPPEGCSPGRGMIFALLFGSLIGTFTLTVLWIPLPILHFTGYEVFEFPTGEQGWVLLISVIANATFSGSFLVLISLTSPVLSSVAALLTIFLVAIVDTIKPGGESLSKAAIIGGLLIIGAFLLLSWSTYRELNEERKKQLENDEVVVDDEEEDEEEDVEGASHLS